MAEYGYLDLLRQYFIKYPLPTVSINEMNGFYKNNISKILRIATRNDRLQMIKYFFEELNINYQYYANDVVNLAITYERWSIFKYILLGNSKYQLDNPHYYRQALSSSPLSGDIELVKSLSQKANCIFMPNTKIKSVYENAALQGRVDMLEWLFHNRTIIKEIVPHYMYEYAVQNGHLDVVQYLVSVEIEFDELQMLVNKLIQIAVKYNHLEMLKYLHSSRKLTCLHGEGDLFNLSGNTDLEIIKWIQENKPHERNTNAMAIDAAKNGRLDIIQWIHTNRPFFNLDGNFQNSILGSMDAASESGSLDVLIWLHENCFPPDPPASAVPTNSQQEPQSAKSIAAAAVAAFSAALGSGKSGCTKKAMDNANSLEITMWLHKNRTEGCTTDAMDNAAKRGDLETLKWLHSNRTEGISNKAIELAAENGHFETVKWLYQVYKQGFGGYSLYRAAQYGYFEIVKWIHDYTASIATTTDTTSDTVFKLNQLKLQESKEALKLMDILIGTGQYEMLKWLINNRNEFTFDLPVELLNQMVTKEFNQINFDMFEYLLTYIDIKSLKDFQRSKKAYSHYLNILNQYIKLYL